MPKLEIFILIVVLVGLGFSGYILYYQIENKYEWFFIVSTSLGIIFSFYRLFSVGKIIRDSFKN